MIKWGIASLIILYSSHVRKEDARNDNEGADARNTCTGCKCQCDSYLILFSSSAFFSSLRSMEKAISLNAAGTFVTFFSVHSARM
jgi:hypothetical protein